MDSYTLAQGEAPVFTVQWEDGVRTSPLFTVATKAEAFATLDLWLALAEYPASLHIVISKNGEPVWEQHGTRIILNR